MDHHVTIVALVQQALGTLEPTPASGDIERHCQKCRSCRRMQVIVSTTVERFHETKIDAVCPNDRELTDYAFGKVNVANALEIQLHLEVISCAFCTERVEHMRAIKEAPLPTPEDLAKIVLPPELIARMRHVFEQRNARQSN